MAESIRDLAPALAREFSTVAASLLGADPAVAPAEFAVEPRWVVRVKVGGEATGCLFLALGDGDAKRLARSVMGLDEDPPDAAVADTVIELSAQAASSLGQSEEGTGLTFGAEAVTAADVPETPRTGFSMDFGDWAGALLVAGEARRPEAATVAEAPAPAPRVITPSFGTPAVSHAPVMVPAGAPPNLDVILDIDLPIAVRFGATDMALQALARLGPGSIIDLERSPDDPVEVLISGKVVARGEVVVVAGNYGVRITEVVSAADRIRSLGA